MYNFFILLLLFFFLLLLDERCLDPASLLMKVARRNNEVSFEMRTLEHERSALPSVIICHTSDLQPIAGISKKLSDASLVSNGVST